MKDDNSWRKCRIAARIVIRNRQHRPLAPRNRRLAAQLAADPAVTNRLIDQAVAGLCVRKGISYASLRRPRVAS